MDVRNFACIGAAGFLGVLLVAAAVTPAHGQAMQRPVTITAHDSMTERVPYGDLSLGLQKDRRVLYRRVSMAVGKVCPILDIQGFAYDWQDCRDLAWKGADPQIEHAIDVAGSGTLVAMTIEVSGAQR